MQREARQRLQRSSKPASREAEPQSRKKYRHPHMYIHTFTLRLRACAYIHVACMCPVVGKLKRGLEELVGRVFLRLGRPALSVGHAAPVTRRVADPALSVPSPEVCARTFVASYPLRPCLNYEYGLLPGNDKPETPSYKHPPECLDWLLAQ